MEMVVVDGGPDLTQVSLVGSLDVQGLHQIDVKFHSFTCARRKPAIIDMSQVDFISSLGMGMLVSCAKSLERNKLKMVILSPQPMVEEALKAARLDLIMPIVRDLDAAKQMVLPKPA